eukprot:Clim_evm6s203 gene=Clim_evmTU6s203
MTEDNTTQKPEALPPSKLGTQEYWESVYQREVTNFQQNGDEGEVWFGEEAVQAILNWVLDQELEPKTKTLDLGCGNGHVLLELAQEADFVDLMGIDYSESSIKLAKAAASARGESCQKIVYRVFDVMNSDAKDLQEGPFDLVVDKGTFDAISLSPDQKKPGDHYGKFVAECLAEHDRAYFVIVSCNWTSEELQNHFEHALDFVLDVPQRSFEFGGHKGQTVSMAIFRKT